MKDEIKQQIIPMLDAYKNYFSSIVDLLLRTNLVECDNNRARVDNLFKLLPDWYYQTRVKIPFEVGRRFFLTKVDQLGETLYSMHYIARHPFDPEIVEKISVPLQVCAEKISLFFDAVAAVLDRQVLTDQVDDFSPDIAKLENQFRDVVPYTVELLEVSKDALYFVEFIYALKELRVNLLKLAEALR